MAGEAPAARTARKARGLCALEERCHYCGAYLATRHEHDHFPVPFRAGGTETVPCCLNCHDLKDRQMFAHWPIGAYESGMLGLLRFLVRTGREPVTVREVFDAIDAAGVLAAWQTLPMEVRLTYAKVAMLATETEEMKVRAGIDKPMGGGADA